MPDSSPTVPDSFRQFPTVSDSSDSWSDSSDSSDSQGSGANVASDLREVAAGGAPVLRFACVNNGLTGGGSVHGCPHWVGVWCTRSDGGVRIDCSC